MKAAESETIVLVVEARPLLALVVKGSIRVQFTQTCVRVQVGLVRPARPAFSVPGTIVSLLIVPVQPGITPAAPLLFLYRSAKEILLLLARPAGLLACFVLEALPSRRSVPVLRVTIRTRSSRLRVWAQGVLVWLAVRAIFVSEAAPNLLQLFALLVTTPQMLVWKDSFHARPVLLSILALVVTRSLSLVHAALAMRQRTQRRRAVLARQEAALLVVRDHFVRVACRLRPSANALSAHTLPLKDCPALISVAPPPMGLPV